MSQTNEKLEQDFAIAAIPGGHYGTIDPALVFANGDLAIANHVEITEGDPWIRLVGINPTTGLVTLVNLSSDEVEDVQGKAIHDHSIESPETPPVTAFNDLGAWQPPYDLPGGMKNLQDVYVIGSADAGDTIDDCDFLHENGNNDAIEDCISEIISTGRPGKVIIRSGTYQRTADTPFPDGCFVQGEGAANTILQKASGRVMNCTTTVYFLDLSFSLANPSTPTDTEVLLIDGQGFGFARPTFERCNISGGGLGAGAITAIIRYQNAAGAAFKKSTLGGVAIPGCSIVEVEAGSVLVSFIDCLLSTAEIGITGTQQDQILIDRCEFVQLQQAFSFNSRIFGARIIKNQFLMDDDPAHIAFFAALIQDSIISENVFAGTSVGVPTSARMLQLGTGGGGEEIHRTEIINNQFLNYVDQAPIVLAVGVGECIQTSIRGNLATAGLGNTNAVAIQIDNADRCIISENTLDGSIFSTGSFVRSKVEQNIIRYQDLETTTAAISIAAMGRSQIGNNQLFLDQVQPGSAAQGIFAPGAFYSRIHHNTIETNNENSTPAILIPATSGQGLRIDHNFIENFPTGIDVELVNNSTVNIDNNDIRLSLTYGIYLHSTGRSRALLNGNNIKPEDGYAIFADMSQPNSSIQCVGNNMRDGVGGIRIDHTAPVETQIVIGNNNTETVTGNPIEILNMIAGCIAAITGNVAFAAAGAAITLGGTGGTATVQGNIQQATAAPLAIVPAITAIPADAPASGVPTSLDVNG